MIDSKTIEEQIKETEHDLSLLKKKKEELDNMKPLHSLATALHNQFCHYNHTDSCDWYYGEKNFDSHAHMVYLKKAKELTSKCEMYNIDTQMALDIFSVMKN